MIINRFLPAIRLVLLFILLATGLFISGCGGSDKKKSSNIASSSVSNSSMRSSFTAASIPANGSGTWPDVRVDATSPKHLTFTWTAAPGATYYRLMKNLGGTNGYVQVGSDITGTSTQEEISVHLQDWINTRYLVEACDGSGCSLPGSNNIYTATEILKSIGYVKGSNSDANDWFGWSLAVSADGQTLAVGAPAEDSRAIGINGDETNNESNNSGAVYVFVKENGLWVQQAYLKASNTEQPNSTNSTLFLPNDRFGYKVAIADDGNTLAVSALLEDSPSYGVNCNQNNLEIMSDRGTADTSDDGLASFETNLGAVYIFQRTASNWQQEAYVKPRSSLFHFFGGTQLRFGETLALSGDGMTLAVGTTSDSIGTSGIFNLANASSSSSSFGCLDYATLFASSTSVSSTATSSIAPSSSLTSDSSSSASSVFPGGNTSGAVYIYIKSPQGWVEESTIKASNAEPGDAFGASVALSNNGNTLAVSAIGEDSTAIGVEGIGGDPTNNGCVYVDAAEAYSVDSSCAALPDKTLISAFNINNGAVYIFKRDTSVWTQQTYLKPAFAFFQTLFGSSIDLSADGMTLAVGASGDNSPATGVGVSPVTNNLENGNSGSAYIFVSDGSTWTKQTYIKPSTLAPGSLFGSSISLSTDGSVLAVGAYRESSLAKGIDGDNGDTSFASAGAAYVFKRNGTEWTQKSYVKASNTDINDRFGFSLDLSNNGSVLAVGAYREAGKGFSVVPSSSSQSSSSAGSLDQNDNSLEAAGAVYLY